MEYAQELSGMMIWILVVGLICCHLESGAPRLPKEEILIPSGSFSLFPPGCNYWPFVSRRLALSLSFLPITLHPASNTLHLYQAPQTTLTQCQSQTSPPWTQTSLRSPTVSPLHLTRALVLTI